MKNQCLFFRHHEPWWRLRKERTVSRHAEPIHGDLVPETGGVPQQGRHCGDCGAQCPGGASPEQ